MHRQTVTTLKWPSVGRLLHPRIGSVAADTFFYGIQHVTPTQCQQWTDNPSRLRSPIYFGIKCFRKRHWKNADWGSQWEKTHLHSFCHSFEPLKMHQGRQVSVKLKAKHSIHLLTLETLYLVVTKINVLWNMTIILSKNPFKQSQFQNDSLTKQSWPWHFKTWSLGYDKKLVGNGLPLFFYEKL